MLLASKDLLKILIRSLSPMYKKIEPFWSEQKKAIKIEWNLGKRCNFDCSYCPAFIHDNTSQHTDIEILKRAADQIETLEDPRVSFTGGEPCVHPDFPKFLEYIRPKVTWINVTTNGTKSAKYYNHLLMNYVDHMVFSMHFEYNWEKCLNAILNVAHAAHNKAVLVHVMMLPGRLTHVKQACRRLRENNVAFALRPIRWTETHDVFADMDRYSAEELDFLKTENHNPPPNLYADGEQKNSNDLLIEKTNQFLGWECNAGLESLMINWDGDVHRATCRVGGSLGNIYTGTFEAPVDTITCTRNWCTCAADIPLSKKMC